MLETSPLTKRQEYEICQRRGHQPVEGPIFTAPESTTWPCKWCGTSFEYVDRTELYEKPSSIPTEEQVPHLIGKFCPACGKQVCRLEDSICRDLELPEDEPF